MKHLGSKLWLWGMIAVAGIGVSPADAEITTTGLIDRFDANLGVTTDGTGAVTGWTNQAIGQDVTVADPQTSVVAGPAGQQLVRFNNTSQGDGLQYTLTNPSPTATNPASLHNGYTVFATVRVNAAYANFYRVLRTTSDVQAPLFLRNTGVMEVKATPLATGSRPTGNFQTYTGSAIPSPIVIVTARLTPTTQDLFFNGTLVSHKEAAIASYNFGAADNIWELGNGLVGDIGDILLYNNTATLADLNATGQTLATQYGITWDNTGLPEPSVLGVLVPAVLLVRRRRRDLAAR